MDRPRDLSIDSEPRGGSALGTTSAESSRKDPRSRFVSVQDANVPDSSPPDASPTQLEDPGIQKDISSPSNEAFPTLTKLNTEIRQAYLTIRRALDEPLNDNQSEFDAETQRFLEVCNSRASTADGGLDSALTAATLAAVLERNSIILETARAALNERWEQSRREGSSAGSEDEVEVESPVGNHNTEDDPPDAEIQSSFPEGSDFNMPWERLPKRWYGTTPTVPTLNVRRLPVTGMQPDLVTHSIDVMKAHPIDTSHTIPEQGESVRFIRLNSRYLSQLHTPGISQRIIVVSPFKWLISSEAELRTKLDHLAKRWRAKPETKRRVTLGSDVLEIDVDAVLSMPEISYEESYVAYADLNCLMYFYDTYVKPRWDYLRSDTITTVRYEDLCYLFQPGDDIVRPNHVSSGPTQDLAVVRVVKVTGGRPPFSLLVDDTSMAQDLRPSDATERGPHTYASEKEDNILEATTLVTSQDTSHTFGDYTQWSPVQLDVYNIAYNGHKFGTVPARYVITYFQGSKSVKDLTYWPLRLANDSGRLRKSLLEVGQTFVDEYCDVSLRHYRGLTPQSTPVYVDSRIVIDHKKTFEFMPSWLAKIGSPQYSIADPREIDASGVPWMRERAMYDVTVGDHHQWDRKSLTNFARGDHWNYKGITADRAQLSENDLLLLPSIVFGYILQTQSWSPFFMSPLHLRKVLHSDRGWNELQLPDTHRRTIESIVQAHLKGKQDFEGDELELDLVEGKGKGAIMLLHGPPGVGKTSTAECIASKYQRPLIPITCGSLGLDAPTVERTLKEKFYLAQSWNGVVLLDEADVFLAERGKHDLQRNALVSVFLRTVEYYNSILFLTTNRTGTFDEAFRSRFHAALYYPELGQKETIAIWRNNVRRLQDANQVMKKKTIFPDNGESIIRYGRVIWKWHDQRRLPSWNGRQIRNAFQAATALAQHESNTTLAEVSSNEVHLTWEHFREVWRMTNAFDRYMTETRGGLSDARRLDDENVRANVAISSDGQTLQRRPTPPPSSVEDTDEDIMASHPDAVFTSYPANHHHRGTGAQRMVENTVGYPRRPINDMTLRTFSSNSRPAENYSDPFDPAAGGVDFGNDARAPPPFDNGYGWNGRSMQR